MKKKVFSLMMTLLLAFIGVAKADVVTIGDGTGTTYYAPYNSLWGYSFVEQVYTADEIGTAGTITAISFNMSSTDSQTNLVDVFMKNVSRSNFSSGTDWETVTASDMVFSGTVTFNNGWTTITLDTPFEYDGTSNLMIGMHEYTSGYSTRYFYYTSVTGGLISGHSDSVNPDPYDMGSFSGTTYIQNYRANIQIDITAGGGGVPATLLVHDGTETNGFVPVYGFYADAYLKCEMVYPAAELSAMNGGTINGMTFYATSPATEAWTSTWQVFVSEVADATISSFYGPGTVVYEGTLDGTGTEMTINFTTPYQYNGGNLLVGVYNIATGNYKSVTWAGETVTGASVQGYDYSSLSGVTASQRNFLPKTNFAYTTAGGGGVQNVLFALQNGDEVETIEVGPRPNGCWMEPFTFQLRNDGPATTVSLIDFTPTDYFTVVGPELPVAMAHNEEIDVQLTTDTSADTLWQMVAIYGEGRTARVWDITAEPYDPRTPDVWEMACENATEFPFVEVPATAHNVTLHNDYTLPFPEIEEGLDAVYKLEFDHDMMLNAEVTYGDNGKVALYTEDFYGEGGPMATNNYNGPLSGAGGAAATPFEAQIGEGTTTTGYFPFYTLYNYSIAENLFLATELTEAGVTTAPMTSLSWYATNAPGYAQQGITIWMANVEDAALTTTSHPVTGMTKVYTGAMTPAVGWNEFVFNEGTFSWDGHSNVLIFCQRNNGSWNSTVNWQATGSMPFTCSAYQYQDSGAYDPTVANAMYTSTTRPNVIMKSEGRNRDDFAYGFESGLEGWSVIDVNSGEGTWLHSNDNPGMYDYTTLAHGGTGFAMCYSFIDYGGSYDTDSYLVSPQQYSIGNGANITFWADNANDNYPESFSVCVSTAANPTAGSFTQVWGGEAKGNRGERATVRRSHDNRYENWRQHTVDLSAYAGQNVWIAFHDVNYDMYEIWIDDVTVNVGGSTPTSAMAYGPVITNAAIEAGTYYLVASSLTPDFEVTINAEDMPCPQVEGFAFNPMPADDEDEIEPANVTLKWNNPAYATEYQVVFGSTYYPQSNHPQTVISDWTPVTGATGSFTVHNLWNNTNYFWYVVFRNDGACHEGVESPHWGFTTHLNVPQDLTAVDETVFNDEQIVLNWNAVVDRTYRQYNVYRKGATGDYECIGHTTVNNIGNTTYTDGPLPYNMTGYTYYVTAVYDEGESAPSNTVNVKVSGYGDVNGHVYEVDGETGIAGATVTMVGQDEFGVNHTYNFTTNNQGYYSGHIYAGSYNGQASCNGYQTIDEPIQGNPIAIDYNQETSPIDYMLDENFDPVCTVIAEYYPDSLDPNSPYVKVYWGCGLPGEELIDPLETGDFSLFDWNITGSYPWEVTTTHPYEGTYCMRSTNYNVASSTSSIDVTVDIPADGIMSFFGYISSESNWDYGYFYIDGVQKGSYTGAGNSWGEKKFDITAGSHNFKWEYTKDGSVNSNEDRFYVDYITFYKRPEPAQPGWHTYCESEFNNAVGSNLTTTPSWAYEYPAAFLHTNYAGWNITKVSLFSDNMYSAVGGNYTCRIYVGGTQPAAGTMVSELTVDVPSNQNAWVDWDLTTPVSVTGNDPIWVVWTANTTVSSWPAGCCGDLNDYGTWWDGGSGWEHLTYGTWTMRHWFTNRAGRSVAVDVADNAPVAVAQNNIASKLAQPVKGEESNAICANPNAVKGAALESGNTRAFSHYRVYRTNCYNDGPYTNENTVVLACELHDTIYIDVEWGDLAPGVYKWGVGCVYVGNRGEEYESPIAWGAPQAVRDITVDGTEPMPAESMNRAPWDLLANFDCTSGYQYGVATDGNYIYTSSWSASSTSQFYKYTMDGTFVEEFNVSGSGQIRDLTYDGQYFYGVANSSTVYCLDLANHALVNSFTSAYGTMRCCGYDPVRDGFWVVGNWSGNLTLINRQGAIVTTGPAPTSASGVTYYKDENDVEHVYCFNNGNNQIYDYDIASNTIASSPIFDFSATPGYTSGSSGGCHVGEYNGKVAFFGDLQQSPNVIGVYELKDAETPGGGGGSQYEIQEPRESEIVWSNCLDKDMYMTDGDVTINVLLNSADSPEGTTVDFVNYNEAEQELYPMDQLVLDETGYYEFPEFRRGIYELTIQHDGYETIIDSVNIWEPTDLRYVMIEIIYGVSDLYVSSTGWAMWGDQGTPGGGGGGGQGSAFSYDLEAGLPAGWNVIDGNNDGWTWCLTSAIPSTWTYYASLTLDWYRSGTDAICSGSYINGVGALNPDEYLVSEQVNLVNGSTFSFWAAATDASYAADHFGVFVSDNGTSGWEMVNEWTLTGKGGDKAGDVRASRDGNGLRLGTWHNFSVDLSAYAGQQKYIAIRHFNCTDQYIMCVDDIELTAGAKGTRAAWEFVNGFVTDPGAMNNGGDASWIKGSQSTYGPGCQQANGNRVGDSFTLDAATTISEIEVYGYQTGSSTNSTFNGLYVQIYDGNPMSGGQVVWGDANANIMTATAFTNCYRGSDGDASGTTRPIMSVTASGLNIELEAGTYWLVYQLNGTGSSGPWAQPHAEPNIGNTGNGVQYLGSNSAWQLLSDSGAGTGYGIAMKLTGNSGSGPTPTGDILGAMIFADGEWEAFVEYPTNTYTYEGEAEEVCVRMVYNGTNNLPEGNIYFSMSCPECEPFEPGFTTCEPGAPIHAEMNQTTDGVKIWWGNEPQAPISEWLYYDDGTYATNVGTGSATTIYWATMFPAASLAPYAGTNLTKVAMYENSYNSSTVTVSICLGGTTAPGAVASTQTFTPEGAQDFHEVILSTPVAIDGTENLWIVMAEVGEHPATACTDTGDANNRWISLDGSAWQDLAEAGLPGYGWMIRGFVTNQGKSAAATTGAYAFKGNGETATGVLSHTEVVSMPADLSFMNRAEIVKYNVYRSTDNETYEMIGQVVEDGSGYYEYIDTPAEGTYYYQVRALYDDDCESDPAPAYDNPTNDYVVVEVALGVGENGGMAIFPNPTKGNVTIQAAGMQHITVVSVLGQVVYDADVTGDELILNMSKYTAGMYTVRVMTENGVRVERITVIR